MCLGRHPGVTIVFQFKSVLFLLGFMPRITESPMSSALVSLSGSMVTVTVLVLCPGVTPASSCSTRATGPSQGVRVSACGPVEGTGVAVLWSV